MLHSFNSPANASDSSESDLPSSFPTTESPAVQLLLLHNDSLFIASHIPVLELACRSINRSSESFGGDVTLIPLLQRIASSSMSLLLVFTLLCIQLTIRKKRKNTISNC